jgi:hypothetical protein
MPSSYVSRNSPVFSSRDFDGFHFTLVVPGPLLVGGKKVVCAQGSNHPILSTSRKNRSKKSRMHLQCTCGWETAYTVERAIQIPPDEKVIRRIPQAEYLATRYPVPTLDLQWHKSAPPTQKDPLENPSTESSSSAVTPLTCSTSASPVPSTGSLLGEESEEEDSDAPLPGPSQPQVRQQRLQSKVGTVRGTYKSKFARRMSPELSSKTTPSPLTVGTEGQVGKRTRGDSLLAEQQPVLEAGSSNRVARKRSKVSFI